MARSAFASAKNAKAQLQIDRWAAQWKREGRRVPGRAGMAAIGNIVVASTRHRMHAAVTPQGTRHKALSPRYVAWKVKKGYSPNIWWQTGESEGKTSVLEVQPSRVTVIINTPWSGYAEDMRQVLGISKADGKNINAVLRAELRKALD